MIVRLATGADLGTLVRLRREWSEENAGGPIDDTAFADSFAAWVEAEHDSRTFFLVEIDGVAVGMANLKHYRRMPRPGTDAGRWGYVGNVYVSAEHRNGGLGEILMRFVASWAKAEGLAHLRLAPSKQSEPFYARLGFRPGTVVQLDPPPA